MRLNSMDRIADARLETDTVEDGMSINSRWMYQTGQNLILNYYLFL